MIKFSKIFLIILLISSVFIRAENSFYEDESPKIKKTLGLKNFFKSLEEYRLNAPWVERELLCLNIQDFDLAFKEVIDIISKEDRRWWYFCDNKNDFNQDDYWNKCLWQCIHYDNWLSNVYVDLINNELIFKDNNESGAPQGTVSLIQYWHIMGQDQEENSEHYINQFYVFFLDCLSHLFCESIDNAYKFTNDYDFYKNYMDTARKSLNLFEKNLKKIKASKYYQKYQLSLNRFKEILSLLEQEKILEILSDL